jgi:hypothetical protein
MVDSVCTEIVARSRHRAARRTRVNAFANVVKTTTRPSRRRHWASFVARAAQRTPMTGRRHTAITSIRPGARPGLCRPAVAALYRSETNYTD